MSTQPVKCEVMAKIFQGTYDMQWNVPGRLRLSKFDFVSHWSSKKVLSIYSISKTVGVNPVEYSKEKKVGIVLEKTSWFNSGQTERKSEPNTLKAENRSGYLDISVEPNEPNDALHPIRSNLIKFHRREIGSTCRAPANKTTAITEKV